MTFNENDVNRDQGGRFDTKVGAPATVRLSDDSDHSAAVLDETLPHGGNRYDGFQAIAYKLSPYKAFEPVMVQPDVANGVRSGFGLAEVTQHVTDPNPDIPWTFQSDENGLPAFLAHRGKRLRYDSAEFRSADDAALAEYGIRETEDERNSRHLGNEIDYAFRDELGGQYDFLPTIEDGKSIVMDDVVGKTADGRDIQLFFTHSHGPTRDGVLYNVTIGGQQNENAVDYLYGSTGRNGEDLSELASALRSIDRSGNFKRRPTTQELDAYEATDKKVSFAEWYSEKGVADGTINYVPYKADDLARVYESYRDPKWRGLD